MKRQITFIKRVLAISDAGGGGAGCSDFVAARIAIVQVISDLKKPNSGLSRKAHKNQVLGRMKNDF